MPPRVWAQRRLKPDSRTPAQLKKLWGGEEHPHRTAFPKPKFSKGPRGAAPESSLNTDPIWPFDAVRGGGRPLQQGRGGISK